MNVDDRFASEIDKRDSGEPTDMSFPPAFWNQVREVAFVSQVIGAFYNNLRLIGLFQERKNQRSHGGDITYQIKEFP